MEFLKISKFSQHSNLFFDYLNKSIFYMHQDRLHLSGAHSSVNLTPYAKYLSRKIKKAALDEHREVLAVETKPKVIHLVSVKDVCTSKVKCKSHIVGFFFAGKKGLAWDLICVTQQGLMIVKLEEELRVVVKNVVNLMIDSYFVDQSLGYLLLLSGGTLLLFSLNSKKPTQVSKYQVGSNIATGPGVTNLLDYTQPSLDSKLISVGLFHSKIYIISLDGFAGTLTLYKKDSIKYSFDLDPGAYNMRIIDNLMILHNFGLQESTIIDRPQNPIVFKVNHRGSLELNPTFIQLGQDFSIDLTASTFLELRLNPAACVESIANPSDSVIFLLRRAKSVSEGLSQLRTFLSLEKNVEPVVRRIVKKDDNVGTISQNQLLTQVLLPCSKEMKNLKFLVKFLLVYIKELIFANIPIELEVQIWAVKLLIKTNELLVLQDLVSFHIIDDSKDTAQLIIELSKRQHFSYGYLLGIDMLNRMKLSSLVMDSMITHGDFYETISLLNERPCPGYDLGKLNKETHDLYTNQMIQTFLKENIY